MTITQAYTLTCSCGWTHTTSTRASATLWKRWHRDQHTPVGSRASESGHVVTVVREATG
jgi:hypothetical protein